MTGVELRADPFAATISPTARSAISPTIEPLRMPAGCPMPRTQLFIWGELGAAAVIGEGAPWGKRATRRKIIQRRHHAGDFLQPLCGSGVPPRHDIETRNGRQQAIRVGVERLRESA